MNFLDASAQRVPGLDLMRALAILWVMLFHFRYAQLPQIFYAGALWMDGRVTSFLCSALTVRRPAGTQLAVAS